MQEVGPVKDVCPSFLQAVQELLHYREFHFYYVSSLVYSDGPTTVLTKQSIRRAFSRQIMSDSPSIVVGKVPLKVVSTCFGSCCFSAIFYEKDKFLFNSRDLSNLDWGYV